MADAVEPLVTAEELILAVPPGSVRYFAVLNQLLEDIADMADSSSAADPADPARDPRLPGGGCCPEVERQAEGEAPTSWDAGRRVGAAGIGAPLGVGRLER